ncbi:MAG: hypothetical protein AAFV88_00420 [Planctomycetota bacterium]
MNAATRRLIIGVGVLVLMVYAAISVSGSRRVARQFGEEQTNLSELKQKIDEIQRWSAAPRVAALDVESPDRILNRILNALDEAGLARTTLSNQTPSEPQRLGQSDFQLRKVDITLGRATMAEVIRFCEALRDESTGSLVRDLQVFDPETTRGRETWKSQMILTQVIFSPKSDS